MKHLTILTALFTFSLLLLTSSAAVPLKWTVETTRAQPATFEAYQGETLDLEATLQSRGKPLELSGIAALYWQTNGMGSTYWEAAAAVNSNRLSAVFTPEMDVGAKVYNCFIGQPGTIYHAAFQLRLRPSPGATPNVLPLPVPVIDFAKVRVLNPPWESGGGGGVNTNAVRDIVRDTLATNGIRSVDGAARPLPKYLHLYETDDSYPDAAADYYAQRQGDGAVPAPQCSSVRSGGFLSRNFDYPFDERAEFVVKMSAGNGRFASVGVAQVGTNLTEQMVTSGKLSKWYKALPGATVDGINENGVACNINVVDGDPQTSGWHTTGNLNPLAAVRWILDNATNAQHAAEYIAANIRFPAGWTQNFHYMVCDATSTYIVENGSAHDVTDGVKVLTNFRLYGDPKDTTGEGQERYIALTNGANITSQWWTLTYTAAGYRASDLPGITGESLTQLFNYWENNPRESHRGESFGDKVWWQTVHTSVYDITNRVLRVSVQEQDDWNTFQVPDAGGVKVETDPTVPGWAKAAQNPSYTKSETDEKIAGKRGIGDLRVYEFSTSSVIAPECLPIVIDGRTIHSYSFTDARQFGINRLMLTDGDGLPLGVDFDISSGVVSVSENDGITFGGRPVTIGSWPYLVGPQPIAGDSVAKTSDTDTKLAGKLDKDDVVNPSSDANIGQAADAFKTGSRLEDVEFLAATADDKATELQSTKANRPESPTAGNIASLTGTGDPADSGIETQDDGKVLIVKNGNSVGYYVKVRAESADGESAVEISRGGSKVTIGTTGFSADGPSSVSLNWDDIAAKSDIPTISATDPIFSNAVDRIVRSLMPTTLRAYDPIRKCWWNIQPVNGVLTLTVED